MKNVPKTIPIWYCEGEYGIAIYESNITPTGVSIYKGKEIDDEDYKIELEGCLFGAIENPVFEIDKNLFITFVNLKIFYI